MYDIAICIFCDKAVAGRFCITCGEYKGLMTINDWEDYTGEIWNE